MQSMYRNEDIRRYRIEFVIFTVIYLCIVPFVLYMKSMGDYLSLGSGCYVRDHFHLYCPGCGGTRAAIALLKGQLIKSFIYNPYPLFICVLVVRIWCTLLYDSFIAGKYRRLITPLSHTEIWVLIFLSLILFIVRNALLLYLHVDIIGDLAD